MNIVIKKVLKIILIVMLALISPFVLLVFGLALLIAGIAVAVITSRTSMFNLSAVIYNSIIIWIFIGALIMAIALVGCCAFIMKSKIGLISYAVGQVALIVASTAITIHVGTNFVYYGNHLNVSLTEQFTKSKESKQAEIFWKYFQPNAWCCGVEGPEDWKDDIPGSCCTEDSPGYSKYSEKCKIKTRNRPYVYAEGCVVIVKRYYNIFYDVIYYSALALTIFSILAFQLTIIICKAKPPRETEEGT